jgi:hypothetical protein
MNFLTNFDLNKNQLLNAVMQKLASAPANPVEGQMYYNTIEHRMKFFNGTTWINADGDDASMTGANIVAAINGSTALIDDDNLSASVNDAIAKRHSHTNSQTLDAITAAYTTEKDSKLQNIEAQADVTDAVNVAAAISSSSAKSAPVDGDFFPLLNSAAANVLNQITWANIKTALKAYTDTLYNSYTHPTGDGNLHVPSTGTANNGKVLMAGSSAGSASWQTPTVAWANITSKPTSTVTDIDDAVSKRHTQNSDTGTSNQTFFLGGTGIKLKNGSGTELQIRNNADNAYADIRVKNIYIEGDTTQINSNDVNIGDSELLLNADLTAAAQNSDGGIAIKRFKADNVTRADVKMGYSESADRWQSTQGDADGTMVTAIVANKLTSVVGDGSVTSFILTHNLNTRDLTVTIRETDTPYAVVYTDVEMTSLNTITVKFAVAPSANRYTVTIVG